MSQIQGTDVVASMVVFEDGLARKSEYRRFIITGATDDVSAISEVLRRRFARYLAARERRRARPTTDRPAIDPETGRARKFAYPPNLVVVDGGAPQVNAAGAVLRELGITDVAVCGLAKRLEEVWLPDEAFPVILPRTSEGLYLLQRVRDEAHRFAITFHRQRRSKRMTASALDGVPGLGEIRRKALLRQFGSLKRLAAASVEEIAEVPGIGRRTAEAILAALGPRRRPTRRPAPTHVGLTRGRQRFEGGRWTTGFRCRALCERGVRPGRAGPERRPVDDVANGLGEAAATGRDRARDGPRHRHRGVRRRSQHGGPGAGERRLLRRRQPAAGAACSTWPSWPSRPAARPGTPRWCSTCAAGPSPPTSAGAVRALRERGFSPRVLFVDADDEVLIRRFESVRRSHPLQGDGRLADGIAAERELLRRGARAAPT